MKYVQCLILLLIEDKIKLRQVEKSLRQVFKLLLALTCIRTPSPGVLVIPSEKNLVSVELPLSAEIRLLNLLMIGLNLFLLLLKLSASIAGSGFSSNHTLTSFSSVMPADSELWLRRTLKLTSGTLDISLESSGEV